MGVLCCTLALNFHNLLHSRHNRRRLSEVCSYTNSEDDGEPFSAELATSGSSAMVPCIGIFTVNSFGSRDGVHLSTL